MNNDSISIKKIKNLPSRSPRFPGYSLESAIASVTEARKFGKIVTDTQLAGNGSIKSGSFLRKKASLGYFGLISGRGDKISITELAEGIIYPKPGEREALIRKAFLIPEVFKVLYTSTAKNVPIPLSTLGNILIRDHSVQPTSKNEFLSVFIRSGIYAGLVKYSDDTESDIIFLEDQVKDIEHEETTKIESSDVMLPVYRYEDISSPEMQTAELVLTNGKAKITVPRDLTVTDVKRLRA